jgi:RHS repeat-associated protein
MPGTRYRWLSSIALAVWLGFCVAGEAMASTSATISVGGSEQQISGAWDSGNITVAFDGFSETVHYGQFSNGASVASALAAMFSNSYLNRGLCAYASGATITFQIQGAGSFGALGISGPTTSFQIQSSGFVSQGGADADSGTITLTVNGAVAATTQYGASSTPISVAAGLAAGVQSGSPVTVAAQNDSIVVQSTATGSNTDYSYSLATTAYDSTQFTQPSFMNPPSTGQLSGGANSGPTTTTPVYNYIIGYQPNSTIGGVTSSVMNEWTYTYDTLNRLATATTNYQQPYQLFAGYCWSYDDFGNRQQEVKSTSAFSTTAGGPATCEPANPAPYQYNTNNQVSSGPTVLSYDQAGNVTIDASGNRYLYDAEGRICAISNGAVDGMTVMTGYIYDGEGQRVAKGPITSWSCNPATNGFSAVTGETDSILNQADQQITEMVSEPGGTMVWSHTNVWAGSQLLGTYSAVTDANGTADGDLHFYLNDWLGTRRVQTDYEGVVEQSCWSLPYGDTESCPPSPTEHLFTGKERDTESGLDNFGARYFGSTMGRFMSPDYDTEPDTVPYAEFENPQTLNLYAYGRNSPMVYNDPDGHDVSVCDNSGKCNTVSNDAYTAAQKGNNGSLNVPTLDQVGMNGNGSGQFNSTAITDANGNTVGTATYVSTGGADYYANRNGLNVLGQAGATMNDPRTYAAWFGASAIGGGLIVAAPAIGAGAATTSLGVIRAGLQAGATVGGYILSQHAVDQAVERGVPLEEIEEAVEGVAQSNAQNGYDSVVRFYTSTCEVRVNKITGVIVTVINKVKR